MNVEPPPGTPQRSRSRGERIAIALASVIAGVVVVLGLLWVAFYVFGLMLIGGGGAGGN